MPDTVIGGLSWIAGLSWIRGLSWIAELSRSSAAAGRAERRRVVVVVVIWEFLSWNGVNLGTPKRGAGAALRKYARARRLRKEHCPGRQIRHWGKTSPSVCGSCREGWSRRPFSGRTLARRCGKHHLWRLYTATPVRRQIIPWRRPDVRSDREVLLVPLAR